LVQSQKSDVGRCHCCKHKAFIVEHRVLADHVSLLQSFKDSRVSFFVVDTQLEEALNDEDDRVAGFASPNDFSPLLKKLFLQEIVDIVEELFGEEGFVKELDLAQDFLLELLPRVFVLQGLLLHLYEHVGEAVAEVVEHLLAQPSQSAVVRTLN